MWASTARSMPSRASQSVSAVAPLNSSSVQPSSARAAVSNTRRAAGPSRATRGARHRPRCPAAAVQRSPSSYRRSGCTNPRSGRHHLTRFEQGANGLQRKEHVAARGHAQTGRKRTPPPCPDSVCTSFSIADSSKPLSVNRFRPGCRSMSSRAFTADALPESSRARAVATTWETAWILRPSPRQVNREIPGWMRRPRCRSSNSSAAVLPVTPRPKPGPALPAGGCGLPRGCSSSVLGSHRAGAKLRQQARDVAPPAAVQTRQPRENARRTQRIGNAMKGRGRRHLGETQTGTRTSSLDSPPDRPQRPGASCPRQRRLRSGAAAPATCEHGV